MLRKLRARITYANVVATLALFVAVGTGGAYAANTVFSSDIVDGEVKSVDVGDAEIKSADVKDESLTTFDVSTFLGADVVDGTLTGADISDNSIGVNDIGSQQVGSDEVVNDSLLQSDIRAGAVTGDEVLDGSLTGFDIQNGQIGQVDLADGTVNSAKVADDSLTNADIQNFSLGNGDYITGSVDSRVATDNSLTGTDINESTLNLPQTPTTATFAGLPSPVGLGPAPNTFEQMASKTLPAGSYAVTATVNSHDTTNDPTGFDTTATCELRNGSGFIGGATNSLMITDEFDARSLSMNGGAQVPSGGGNVSLWCRSPNGDFEIVDYAQMMIIRLDGFF